MENIKGGSIYLVYIVCPSVRPSENVLIIIMKCIQLFIPSVHIFFPCPPCVKRDGYIYICVTLKMFEGKVSCSLSDQRDSWRSRRNPHLSLYLSISMICFHPLAALIIEIYDHYLPFLISVSYAFVLSIVGRETFIFFASSVQIFKAKILIENHHYG